MAKSQEEAPQSEQLKQSGAKKAKESKGKGRDALVGRVKKAVKKSRRKLSEEKFEKELQRTIAFLEQLRTRIAEPQDGQPAMLAQTNELTDATSATAAKGNGKKSKRDKSKKKDAAPTIAAATAQLEAPPGD